MNPTTFKIVVMGLTLALFVQIVGYVVLAIMEKNIPEELSTITFANFTGLLGLIVKSAPEQVGPNFVRNEGEAEQPGLF